MTQDSDGADPEASESPAPNDTVNDAVNDTPNDPVAGASSATDPQPAAPSTTPAGWYPDGTGSQRWWDGQQWSEHAAPMPAGATSTDPKSIAALVHASGIVFGFVGPLVGYLVYPNDPFIREHSRQALNFQITVLIGVLVSFVLMIVLVGFLTLAVIMIGSLVLHIQAAIAASKGQTFQYPATIQFIT